MNKNLSPLGLLWISLTSMIGSGWLFGPLYSAHFAGPAAILAWPIAGILLLFVAFCYAEVGSMFPEENNLARLPFYTHGHLTSLIISCLTWLSLATIPVIETQGLIQYASNYVPNVMTYENLHYVITPMGYVVALILLLSFVFLNYFGVRFFARINAGFTLWKLLIPSITIIAFLSTRYQSQNFWQYGGFMPYGWEGVMAAMSSGGVLFSLLGFRQVIIMMCQIENPGKYLPLVLFSSLALTTCLYTGLQWAFIGSLQAKDLLHHWAHLSFPGDAGPFAALAALTGMIWLSRLLYIDAFISPYSTGLVYSTTGAFMLASISTMDYAPKILAEKNNYNVPWISLCVNFLLGAVMFFLLKSWQEMASFIVAALMLSYAIGPICLVCLRKQLPHYNRPFRLYCGPIVAFIGFYVCTAGVYWSGVHSVIRLLVLVALGMSIYLLYNRVLQNKHKEIDSKNSFWLLCYLISLGVFSYLGNYGGKHWIPLYWDMIYLMGLSFLIFCFAFFSKKSKEYTEKII
jgi:amino acid transporter